MCCEGFTSLSRSLSPSAPAFQTFVDDHLGYNLFSSLFQEKKNLPINPWCFPLKYYPSYSKDMWFTPDYSGSFMCHQKPFNLDQGCSGSWDEKWTNSPQAGLQFIAGHHPSIKYRQYLHVFDQCEEARKNPKGEHMKPFRCNLSSDSTWLYPRRRTWLWSTIHLITAI